MSRTREFPVDLNIPRRVYGNFRPNRFESGKAPQSWRAKRTGMSEAHLSLVRQLPCAFCPENRCIQAHHLKSGAAASERGVFLKATDRWSIPVCAAHHGEIERLGSRKEREHCLSHGIDPHNLAQGLWNVTGDFDRMVLVLNTHKLMAIRTLSDRRRLMVDLKRGEWKREGLT